MKSVNFYVAGGLLAGMLASTAGATTLGLTTGLPTLHADSATISYLEFPPDGDLSTFGALVVSAQGVAFGDPTTINFALGFLLADPTSVGTGGVSVTDFGIYAGGELYLGGEIAAIGYTDNVIELQFDHLIGTHAAAFGTSIVTFINFVDNLGSNPFASLVDGDEYAASLDIASVLNVPSIPLPATLPLGLAGLGMLSVVRRRRSDAI